MKGHLAVCCGSMRWTGRPLWRAAQIRFKSTTSSSAEAAELRALLERLSQAYYNEEKPLVSDGEWDLLAARLAQLEGPESLPVGATPEPGRAVGTHSPSMLSLQSTRDMGPEGLGLWKTQLDRQLGGGAGAMALRFTSQLKYDGMALALRFDAAGILAAALTRGDGRRGEILSLPRLLQLCPELALPRPPRQEGLLLPCEVRGELVMDAHALQLLANQYNSARNAVAGLLRRDDPLPAHLTFIGWDVLGPPGVAGLGVAQRSAVIRTLGISTCQHEKTDLSWEQVLEEVAHWTRPEVRASESLPTDGIVVKLEGAELCQALGSTAHHPRHQIAFKWQAAMGAPIGMLREIEWRADQRARLRPVGVLAEPVDGGGGAQLSRVSLHNWAFVKKHQLGPGSRLGVERAGGVVPHAIPIEGGGTGAQMPVSCPCGQSGVVDVAETKEGPCVEEDEEEAVCLHLRCSLGAARCPDAKGMRAVGAATAIGWRGLAVASGRAAGRIGLLDDDEHGLEAILGLTREKLLTLPRWGDRRASAAVDERQRALSEAAGLEHVIEALGVAGLGTQGARRLAEMGSLQALSNASVEDLSRVGGIGEAIAAQLKARLTPAKTKRLTELLEKAGWPPRSSSSPPSSGTVSNGHLQGVRIAVTGRLSVPRREAAQAVRMAGGRLESGLAKKTNYLVKGSGGGASEETLERARRYQVPIIDEDAFHHLLTTTGEG